MSPLILDGKVVAESIYVQLRERAAKLIARTGITPVLATIVVGDDYASHTYVKMKANACKKAGLDSHIIALPAATTTEQLIDHIETLNADPAVAGILLQHPVPTHIDEPACFNAIDPRKDSDGVNFLSFARNALGEHAFGCATPQGIMDLLAYYKIDVAGKLVVVMGRSAIVGKPLAMMMLNKNATVMVCHSKTQDIKSLTRQADILCVAIGRPEYVDETWIKDGVVLVDAGYNEGNVGDTALERIKAKTSAYTPVPGGVGPMTIATLIRQTLEAAENHWT